MVGDRRIDHLGYVRFYLGEGLGRCGWVLEHRIIAAGVLGRAMRRSECVHHINENRADNRYENLLICDHAFHRFLHARLEARRRAPRAPAARQPCACGCGEPALRRYAHGHNRRGQRSSLTHRKRMSLALGKLDASGVGEIRRRRADGEPVKSIALDLGVSQTHASRIARRIARLYD